MNLIKICGRTCDMTLRSYFGKMNSTLGSVVPLAMFFLLIIFFFDQSSFSLCVFVTYNLCEPDHLCQNCLNLKMVSENIMYS